MKGSRMSRSSYKKVVLAYSGGLDTSVILKWLEEVYGCEVIAFCADLGQGEDLKAIKKKAQSLGVKKVYVEDLREVFVKDHVFPMLRGNAIYEGSYLLGTSIARPLIARRQIEIAADEGAAAHHRARHDAEAAALELLGVVFGELGRHLVPVAQGAAVQDAVVLEAEGEQNRLLDPLMGDPLAFDLLGDAQLALVELGEDELDGLAHLCRRLAGLDPAAVFPGLLDDLLKVLHCDSLHSFLQNASILRAASRHSSRDATSAMRTKCSPGLTPPAARAR